MYYKDYKSLSKADRRAAQRLANKLLKSIPEGNEPHSFDDPRELLYSAFMKPERLIAVFIYRNKDDDNWRADVVFRLPKGIQQVGVEGDVPLKSYEAALERVSEWIAALKVTKEHPIVGEVRDLGYDLDDTAQFEVRQKDLHASFLLTRPQVPDLAVAFSAHVFPTAGNSFTDRIASARAIVFDSASEVAGAHRRRQSSFEQLRVGDIESLFCSAVGYFLFFGFDCIDDCDDEHRFLAAANARFQELWASSRPSRQEVSVVDSIDGQPSTETVFDHKYFKCDCDLLFEDVAAVFAASPPTPAWILHERVADREGCADVGFGKVSELLGAERDCAPSIS